LHPFEPLPASLYIDLGNLIFQVIDIQQQRVEWVTDSPDHFIDHGVCRSKLFYSLHDKTYYGFGQKEKSALPEFRLEPGLA